MVLLQALRRAAGAACRAAGQQRRHMGGAEGVPKADTTMDHVFGDNSFRLPYNFEPPSMARTATLTVATLGVFGLPVWVMAYGDYQMASFMDRLEAAKAKKAAPAEADS